MFCLFLLAAASFLISSPVQCYASTRSTADTSTEINHLSTAHWESPTKLEVRILSATFEHKSIPVYKNENSCLSSQSEVVGLNMVVKVTNLGASNYQVDQTDLKKEPCSDILSYPSFYTISIAGMVLTSSEKCVSDSIDPVTYTCNNPGISPGNYFVSSQWIDLSKIALTSGAGYDITVSILNQNKLFTTVSDPFKVTFTTSRKRTLRSQKAHRLR